jgi:tetratricopeptide (TPR) repeat protein
VNNVVQQPDNIGHEIMLIGDSTSQKVNASADSVAIYYMEALAQFLNEEDYYQRVVFYPEPIRSDTNFLQEKPLTPERMNQIRKETATDAVISLDRLILQTIRKDYFQQHGFNYGEMTGRLHSVLRVYMPTLHGKIPTLQYSDTLRWEGFDIQDKLAYAEVTLPSREEAMKELVVRAADKMTHVFAPHWETQDRWYYTLPHTLMREGEMFAKGADWEEAIEKWESFYNIRSNKIEKAKAASNIALAWEMLDEMQKALEWAEIAHDLFTESTSSESLYRKRANLYKNELQRRLNVSNGLHMDDL